MAFIPPSSLSIDRCFRSALIGTFVAMLSPFSFASVPQSLQTRTQSSWSGIGIETSFRQRLHSVWSYPRTFDVWEQRHRLRQGTNRGSLSKCFSGRADVGSRIDGCTNAEERTTV